MTIGDEHPQRSNRGHRRRLWLLGLTFLVLLVILVAGAIWNWRLPLAERALASVAKVVGLELQTVSVDRLDFFGAEISDLRLGPAGSQSIANARLTWSLSELLERRVSAIEISGASVQVTVRSNGKLVLEGLPISDNTGRTAAGTAFPTDLPFTRMDVVQSRVTVTLPDGNATVAFEGRLKASPGSLSGEISTRYSTVTARGSGSGRGSGGGARGQQAAS